MYLCCIKLDIYKLRKFLFLQELTVGLGVPVEVNPESVTIGFALQTNFLLPSNVSQLWSHLADPFDVSDQSNEKRSIERGRFRELRDDYDEQKQSFHKYSTKSDVRSKRANNSASMRWTVYKALAKVAERCIVHTFHT